ncbi:hypothetical protein HJP15_10035 [Pseudoalteromonas sp. NEC-BIFX-2020_002]|uniref:hypothetical protein n=1 Tax=Pseudoalteromonas TaxID=53246 RepID=UPI0006C8C777|nr:MULTISPECIES: hypothetical protein [Pseudoalteromonas]NNG43249.1 hypothetical protein [Pseudoalteromonas sp. NEC-BIFX-2020_002]
MKNLIMTILAATGFMLQGCGGGSDDTNTSTPIQGETPAPVSPPVVTPVSTADLVATPEFDFSTQFELLIDVKLTEISQRAYLNVCVKPQLEQPVDYNNCIYRSPISSLGIKQSVTIANSETELVALIWFYDGSTEPLTYQWMYESGQTEQSFIVR